MSLTNDILIRQNTNQHRDHRVGRNYASRHTWSQWRHTPWTHLYLSDDDTWSWRHRTERAHLDPVLTYLRL